MQYPTEHEVNDGEAKSMVEGTLAPLRGRFRHAPFLIWRDDNHADLGFPGEGLEASRKNGPSALRR
jgi:hypothetical protein